MYPFPNQAFDPNSYNAQLASIQKQINSMNAPQYAPVPIPPPAPQPTPVQVQHVSGLDGARKYRSSLSPGSSVVVLDSNTDVMYLVSTDANGNPNPIAVCPYTVQMENEQETTFVTKKDFDDFKEELRKLLVKEKDNEQLA